MTEVITTEAKELAASVDKFAIELDEYQITSNETYECAGEHLKLIKAKTKALTDQRMSITRPMDAAKAKVMDFFKPPLDALNNAERTLKGRMIEYNTEQERIRKEAERKQREAEEAARKKAEEEALELAQIAEAEGDAETAEQILEEAQQPITPATPARVFEKPKAAGTHMRDNWKAEVIDLMTLVKAVAAGRAPITTLQANTTVLGQMAKATKGTQSIDGVRFYNEPVISARA